MEAFRIELAEARKNCAGEAESLRILDGLEAWSLELGVGEHINHL